MNSHHSLLLTAVHCCQHISMPSVSFSLRYNILGLAEQTPRDQGISTFRPRVSFLLVLFTNCYETKIWQLAREVRECEASHSQRTKNNNKKRGTYSTPPTPSDNSITCVGARILGALLTDNYYLTFLNLCSLLPSPSLHC